MRRYPALLFLLATMAISAASCTDGEPRQAASATPHHVPDLVLMDARAVADGIAVRIGNQANGAFQGTVTVELSQAETQQQTRESIDLAPYDDSEVLVVPGDWTMRPGAPRFEATVDVESGPPEERTDNNTFTFECGADGTPCEAS